MGSWRASASAADQSQTGDPDRHQATDRGHPSKEWLPARPSCGRDRAEENGHHRCDRDHSEALDQWSPSLDVGRSVGHLGDCSGRRKPGLLSSRRGEQPDQPDIGESDALRRTGGGRRLRASHLIVREVHASAPRLAAACHPPGNPRTIGLADIARGSRVRDPVHTGPSSDPDGTGGVWPGEGGPLLYSAFG